MSTRRRRQAREWIAVLATFVLFVHTAIAGVVDGALASPQLLDVFGNVICTSHGADRGPTDDGNTPGHSHLPDCCLAGCTVAGGHAMPLAAAAFLPVAPAKYERILLPANVVVAGIFELTPLNPRAPPVLA